MEDIATLGIAINSDPAVVLEERLAKVVSTGGQAEGQMKDLSNASNMLAVAEGRATSAAREMAEQINSTSAALAKETTAANALAKADKSAGDSVLYLSNAHKQLNATQSASTSGTAAAGNEAKKTGYLFTQLSFQLNDVVTGFASGQKPMQIFAQQGGQVFQALQMGPGGLGGSLKALTGLFSPMALGIGLVVGGLGGMAYATYAADQANAKLEASTLGVGMATGMTAQDLGRLADAAAKTGNVSVGSARDMEAGYIRMGVTNGTILEGLITSTKNYSRVTGLDMKDAVAELGNALGDPIHGVDTLSKSIGGLDDDTKEYIKRLVREGEIEKAQAILLADIKKQTDDAADSVHGLAKAWEDATKWGGNFLHVMGRVFGGASDKERAEAYSGFGYNPSLDAPAQTNAKAANNKADAEHVALSLQAGEAARALLPKEEQIKKIRSDIVVLNKAIAAGDIDRATALRAVAAGEQQIAKLKETPESRKAAAAAEAAAKAAERRAEANMREYQATEAQIAGNIDLARSIAVGTVETMKSEAETKANTEAIRKQTDAHKLYLQQIRLMVSEQVVAAAKTTDAVEFEADSRLKANNAIAAGTLSIAEANRQMKDEAQLRPFIAAQVLAEGEAKEQLTMTIQRLKAAQKEQAEQEARYQVLVANQNAEDQIAQGRLQLDLIGKTNEERAVAVAQLTAMQYLKSIHADPETAESKKYIENSKEAARVQAQVQSAQNAYNASLGYTLELLTQIDSQVQQAAAGIGTYFGKLGQGITNVITVFSAFNKAQEVSRKKREDDLKAITGHTEIEEKRRAQIEVTYSRESTNAQLDNYANLAGAAKSFFGEKTAAYKILQGVEEAYRAVQLAGAIKSMMIDNGVTVTSLFNSAKRAAAHGIEAIAKVFATIPPPYSFAVAAATAAALVAAGVAVFGGGGGGSGGATDAADRQKAQGAGTVLGDAAAKSDSIAKAIDEVAKNTNQDLEYSNAMLKSLRVIETNITSVAAAVAKSLSVGGQLDTSNLGLGTTVNGPSVLTRIFSPLSNLLPGLFGSTVNKTLQDQGLSFKGQSVSDILSGGISGQSYQQVLTETKKKFLGVTYSDKTKQNTSYSALDDDLKSQLTSIVGSLKEGVLSAASILGVTGAGAVLDQFKVELGKISFKDLTGDEIQKQLEAVFSKLGDQMATTAVPLISELQKVGEGAFETLTRVAREYQTLDVSLSSIGKTFGIVGLGSLLARQRLIDLSGGIDALVEQTSSFADNYLSDAEKLAPIASAVNKEMTRLGLGSIKTKDQFKSLVLGLDVSTEAGATLYAALMMVAPAFAKVQDAAKELADTARDDLTSAYQRESQALQDTIDKFTDFSKSLATFRDSLYSGPAAALSPEDQYNASRALFLSVADKAKAGDQDALGSLQTVSQAYLDASKAYFASSSGYFQDLQTVKDVVTAAQITAEGAKTTAESQLDQLTKSVEGLITINESVLSVKDAIVALQTALGIGPTPAVIAAIAPIVVQTVAANDDTSSTAQAATATNAETVKVLGEIRDELAAANLQRGVATQAQLDALNELLTQLEAQTRAAQRA